MKKKEPKKPEKLKKVEVFLIEYRVSCPRLGCQKEIVLNDSDFIDSESEVICDGCGENFRAIRKSEHL